MTETPPQNPADQSSDTQVIDWLASLLANPEWAGADYLEYIADEIGKVRPHPGYYKDHEEYAPVFLAATGRELPPNPTD